MPRATVSFYAELPVGLCEAGIIGPDFGCTRRSQQRRQQKPQRTPQFAASREYSTAAVATVTATRPQQNSTSANTQTRAAAKVMSTGHSCSGIIPGGLVVIGLVCSNGHVVVVVVVVVVF
ncbi:hypothetical protein LSAT2_007887 [Lamellibrachia satsuma]|nr:hypothetical protein LSAT2_007887 [Lamellibrachia satsuma]